MRVMVFAKMPANAPAPEPTPEMLEAFAAMDRYTEELVAAVGLAIGLTAPAYSPVRQSLEEASGVFRLFGKDLLQDRAGARMQEIVASVGEQPRGIDMLVFYPAGKVMDLRGRAWVAVPSMLIIGVAMTLTPFTA